MEERIKGGDKEFVPVRLPGVGIRDDVMALVAQQEQQQTSAKGRAQWIVLAVCLLALAAVVMLVEPWNPRGGEEPRSSEARAALGAIKDRAREAFRRNPELKTITMQDLGLGPAELNGSYFKQADYTYGGTPEKFWAECRNVYSSKPTSLRVECNLNVGYSTFNR